MTKKTNHTKDEQSEVRGIEEIVNEVYPEHYSCEDCWYSCPLHPDSCAEGDECDCRLEEKRKNLTQTLQHLQERLEAEKRCGKEFVDGSICNCIKDCHLHDWRQKEHTQAFAKELIELFDESGNEVARNCVLLTATRHGLSTKE